MNESITYEIKLLWWDFIQMPLETEQLIIDDINSFCPTVPIETIFSSFWFSVLNEEERLFIYVKTTIDTFNLFGDKPIKPFLGLLDEVVVGRIKDILFAMNLAYPGHIFIHNSILYRNGSPVQSLSYSTDLSALAYRECKWLSFEKLTIKQCWDWLITRTNFLSFSSKTPMDRALHALSYESIANDDMFIFYVLLGIEAIYNDGSNKEDSISTQLKRKIQAIIGMLPPKAIKEVNTMYKRRSALVHGSANIYKCWPPEDSTEETELISEERDFIITATGILIASIQRFIKSDANVIKERIKVCLECQ